MTVGIAALALEGHAIVLMADKLITHGGDLTLERTETKGGWLPNGWMALYAGGTTFADFVLSHVEVRFEEFKPTLAFEVMDAFHKAYTDVWEFLVEREILKPRLLTADQYRAGVSDAITREQIEAEKDQFERDQAPDFLLAGFDDAGDGHVLAVGLRGLEDCGDFGAIGSGGQVAQARLIWQATSASDDLARVVYEAYTAKAHAERNAFVGPGMDAFVMYGNGQTNLRAISDPTKQLLAKVFAHHDQTPFRIARRQKEKSSEAPPPDADWERTLIRDILPLPAHLVPIRERILGTGWNS